MTTNPTFPSRGRIRSTVKWGLLCATAGGAGLFACHDTALGEPKNSNQKALASVNKSYRKNVKPIFREKCFDCHSAFVRYPWYHALPVLKGWLESEVRTARAAMDLSHDFPFSGPSTPKQALRRLRLSLKKSDVHPWYYDVVRWGGSLSRKEKESILGWIDSAKRRLASPGEKAPSQTVSAD